MCALWSREAQLQAIFAFLDASSGVEGNQLVIVKKTILETFLNSFTDEQLQIFTRRIANQGPKSEPTEHLGAWVKSCRLSLGWSQKDLAAKLELSQGDLSNLEINSSRLKLGKKREQKVRTILGKLINEKRPDGG